MFSALGEARFCSQNREGPLVKKKRSESALHAWLVSPAGFAYSRKKKLVEPEGEHPKSSLPTPKRMASLSLCSDKQFGERRRGGGKRRSREELKWFASSENLY